MLVYLCDLSHVSPDGRFASELVPYGIGCLKSYALAHLPQGLDVRLFKDPRALHDAFRQQVPDVSAFSHYLWNARLSYGLAERIKGQFPGILTILGGPNFPIGAADRDHWMRQHPAVDHYVVGDGEIAFTEVIGDFLARREIPEVGCWHASPRLLDLSSFPSPYLTGILDPFLEDPRFLPVLEGNRGCPFTCTFCVDGMPERGKVVKHDPDRLKDELCYIAQRTTGKTLFITDANFGMYREDVEFSEAFTEVRERYDFPHSIVASTGKNNKARVLEVARNLGGTLRVAGSVQSLDEEVLANIRRSNVRRDVLMDVPLRLRASSTNTYSELILGLPGDTAEKHIRGACELIDAGFDQIRMHQLTLFHGSEIDTQRERYQFQTAHRVLQRCFGEYPWYGEPCRPVELEEIVIAHQTMTQDDYFACREFALTVALFYNEQTTAEIGGLLRHLGHRPSEFVRFVHQAVPGLSEDHPVAGLYRNFRTAAIEELFTSQEEAEAAASESRFFLDLVEGRAGNNLLFNAQGRALWRESAALNKMAFRMAREFIACADVLPTRLVGDVYPYLDELERYCAFKKGYLHELEAVDRALFWHDFLALEVQGFEALPGRLAEPILLEFSFESWQRELFGSLLDQFGATDQGLGKLVARAPMKHTHRKATAVYA